MEHVLKCWPEYYQAVKSGEKTFEIRLNDRNFQIGDTLILAEWHSGMKKFTGGCLMRTITYMTGFEQKPGYVVLGFLPPVPENRSLNEMRGSMERMNRALELIIQHCKGAEPYTVAAQVYQIANKAVAGGDSHNGQA